MLYESSWPLVVICLLGGIFFFYLWMQTQQTYLLGLSILVCAGAGGVAVLDYVVETDREHLQTLFPRLARAVERQEYEAVFTVLDPHLYQLREDIEKVIEQTQPERVLITYCDVAVDDANEPPSAIVDIVVRVATSSSKSHMPRDMLADIRVLLQKKSGIWRIIDAAGRRPDFGRQR